MKRKVNLALGAPRGSRHPGIAALIARPRRLGLRPVLLIGVAAVNACVPPPPPPAAAPQPAPVVYTAPDTVWTASAPDSSTAATTPFPRPFTRLDVIGADSATLLVRCGVCADTAARRISRDEVIHRPLPIDSAATGSVADFALAIRAAAAQRDLVALRPLMSLDFAFSAIGVYGRDLALSSWISDNFRILDRVPALLDQGLTPLGDWWVAPEAYATVQDYPGLRIGFRRTPAGRWEWVFLMRGELDAP